MKKTLTRKLSLSVETVCRLNNVGSEGLRHARGGVTDTTCFQTCNCKSGDTCDWSDCGCPTSWC